MSDDAEVGDEDVAPTTVKKGSLMGVSVLGYELGRTIGFGGMGEVYEAHEPNIGRRAAVKVLLGQFADNDELVERFKAEARAANAARHRGIIDVFGFATLPDGRHAIVMEYLDGRPLNEVLDDLAHSGDRLPIDEALRIIESIASALQAAHGAGVVHRDLKPSNIFLCREVDQPETVKVLDFGIAKLDRAGGPKTGTHVVLGTPLYMSPEQARATSAAPSMDVYSLGVIAFELLTSRVPFKADNLLELMRAHQTRPAPRPSSIVPELDVALDEFVLSMLEKDPTVRVGSAREVREQARRLRTALRSSAETASLSELPVMPPVRSGPPSKPVVATKPALAETVEQRLPRASAPRPGLRSAETIASPLDVTVPPAPESVRPPPRVSPTPTTRASVKALGDDEAELGTAQVRALAMPRRSRWPWLVAGAMLLAGVGAWQLSGPTPAPVVLAPAPAPVPLPEIAVAPAPAPAPVEPLTVPPTPEPAPEPVQEPQLAVEAVGDAGAVNAQPSRLTKVPTKRPRAPEDRFSALQSRLARLQKRLEQLSARDESMALQLAQVKALRARQAEQRDERTLDGVETATERLEGAMP